MKKLFTILVFLSLMIGSIMAQTPGAFKYQAVVRDNAGQIIVSQNVSFRISILEGSASGSSVYSEKHSIQTNAFGLVNLEIGNGTNLSGSFSTIDWGSSSYFVKIELDANDSGSFSEMGVSQLMSVPYAMYAEQSGDGLKITGTPQRGDILYNNGLSWELLSKGANGQTLRLDNGMPIWGEPGYALPIVTTNPATDVLQTGATSGGNVIATGYTNISARGVCWSTDQNPTIADSKTTEPVGIGTFTSTLNGLLTNTTYYLRAYATNGAGTAYGNQVTFKTFLTVVFPTITTSSASNITESSAVSGGNVTATGGAEVSVKGICWGINQNPTIADTKTNDGTGTGQFNSQMTNLNPGTTYNVRAFATNSAGTGYGSQVTLTALKTTPTVVTKNITDISAMGAVTGGTIPVTGGGTISDKGICWGEFENPTVDDNKISAGTGATSFNSAIATAIPGKTYYVRAYATNEIGTVYGSQKSFTTLNDVIYYGFESGKKPAGWSGEWTVSNVESFEGNYSLRSVVGFGPSEAILTANITNAGQISFYYRLNDFKFEFYIDDILIRSFPRSTQEWNNGFFDVAAGTHVFKWRFYGNSSAISVNYIDYIILPK